MKKLLTITTLAAALFAGQIQAEEGQRPDRAERMERMREHLDLSDTQVEQMREIHERGGSREEMRAVLNEEQREKAKARKGKHKKHHEGEGGAEQED